ncbi:immunoglobulin lambda-1 light chain-like [Melanotaenia boesemani]|uniref:immunoglobulin lambda-1 light chain-like n=1 Tax=Melanotaenia boesemani TaxID=1250792 RepID=UPI001C045DD8|nr:immunoglobulin lambda-1 light chain-like [Melanotaenia boesemani]
MLFLPAAALCWLCSALVAMAAELIQDDLTLTRRVGQSVSFRCGNIHLCDSNDSVYWYQKTEQFRLILYIDKVNGYVGKDSNHPQKHDFWAVNTQNGCELLIEKVKPDHSTTYYCSCRKKSGLVDIYGYDVWYLIFGSGTKLYVTEEQMVKPVVNVCPIESNVHQEGKSSLLCLASAMFPPLVQFSWKRQKEDGSLEELLPAEGQFRGSKQSAVIRVVDGDALSRYKYICYVKHEGGTVEAQTQQEVPASPPPPPPPASPPPASPPPVHATTPPLLQEEIFPPSDPAATSVPVLHPVKLSVSFQSELRVKLLLLLSTVLIVKSLVYCCGLSLLMILRNKGPSTNCTHAD